MAMVVGVVKDGEGGGDRIRGMDEVVRRGRGSESDDQVPANSTSFQPDFLFFFFFLSPLFSMVMKFTVNSFYCLQVSNQKRFIFYRRI
jgi:hypothetical protein